MKTLNEKPHIVFSYQDFSGKNSPENILLTFERDNNLSREKNFEHVISRVREAYFNPKPSAKGHD